MSNTLLGKRKRPISSSTSSQNPPAKPQAIPKTDSNADDIAEQALQRILQRHFEAKFAPLNVATARTQDDKETEDGDEFSSMESDSDWEGLEEQQDHMQNGGTVQVIEHQIRRMPSVLSRSEAKAFMNSKPPPIGAKTTSTSRTKPTTSNPEETKLEKLNLKNDLELQRLINESHLLDASSKKNTPAPSTNFREKILDTRMRALGSKSSFLQQEKMPMAHRKGIIAKSKDREIRRRQDAKENGIILEKETKRVAPKAKPKPKRTRGVTGPAIGKFKGGTLKLSSRDLASMSQPRRTMTARRK